SYVVDNKAGKGWAVDGPTKKENRKAMFLAPSPVKVPANATLSVTLHHEAIDRHNIGRFRLAVTSAAPSAVKLDGMLYPPSLLQALEVQAVKRTPKQRQEIEQFFLANADSPIAKVQDKVNDLKKRID